MDTTTTYLGLKLENPIMVGAGPLTRNPAAVRRCADAGAGAVGLPSLFEERIARETATLSESFFSQEAMHTEVFGYLESHVEMQYGARDYLEMLRKSKQSVEIPVIASLNCVTSKYWQEFAREIEAAGADALELNIGIMPDQVEVDGRQVEAQALAILAAARAAVRLPLAVKIGANFSSLPATVAQMAAQGADACVLCNRFWTPAIDIEKQRIIVAKPGSANQELGPVLRLVSLLADRTKAQICANTGIHSGADIVRTLLAGATAAQVVTAPLLQGLHRIGDMLDELKGWMQRSDYSAIEDFRGKLSQTRNPEQTLFSRTQYMGALATRPN